MSKQSSKYKSPSTGDECTAAQLIAEIMTTREARKKKISLPLKFWNIDPWRKKYQQQIIAANALFKLYSPEAILATLRIKRLEWVYSLRFTQLVDAIKEAEIQVQREKQRIKQASIQPVSDINAKPAIRGKKGGQLQRLR